MKFTVSKTNDHQAVIHIITIKTSIFKSLAKLFLWRPYRNYLMDWVLTYRIRLIRYQDYLPPLPRHLIQCLAIIHPISWTCSMVWIHRIIIFKSREIKITQLTLLAVEEAICNHRHRIHIIVIIWIARLNNRIKDWFKMKSLEYQEKVEMRVLRCQ